MKKFGIIFAALAIVTLVIVISVSGQNQNVQLDFFVSKLSPNSAAYFVCKTDGMKEGNKCSICEEAFQKANDQRDKLGIKNDLDLIAYVKGIDKDCVNFSQGGN
jgi:hypothetical protein